MMIIKKSVLLLLTPILFAQLVATFLRPTPLQAAQIFNCGQILGPTFNDPEFDCNCFDPETKDVQYMQMGEDQICCGWAVHGKCQSTDPDHSKQTKVVECGDTFWQSAASKYDYKCSCDGSDDTTKMFSFRSATLYCCGNAEACNKKEEEKSKKKIVGCGDIFVKNNDDDGIGTQCNCDSQIKLFKILGKDYYCCGTKTQCEEKIQEKIEKAREERERSVTAEILDNLNPLKQESSLAKELSTPAGIINRLLKYAFPIAGIILFLMLIWGGFEILSGAASKKSLDAGKQRITAAIAGFFLLFASYWIVQIIEQIFGVSILGG